MIDTHISDTMVVITPPYKYLIDNMLCNGIQTRFAESVCHCRLCKLNMPRL